MPPPPSFAGPPTRLPPVGEAFAGAFGGQLSKSPCSVSDRSRFLDPLKSSSNVPTYFRNSRSVLDAPDIPSGRRLDTNASPEPQSGTYRVFSAYGKTKPYPVQIDIGLSLEDIRAGGGFGVLCGAGDWVGWDHVSFHGIRCSWRESRFGTPVVPLGSSNSLSVL
jgi:hypothetical protein